MCLTSSEDQRERQKSSMHSSGRTLETALVKLRRGCLTSVAGEKRQGQTSQLCGGSALQWVHLLLRTDEEDGTGREEVRASRFRTRDTKLCKFLAGWSCAASALGTEITRDLLAFRLSHWLWVEVSAGMLYIL